MAATDTQVAVIGGGVVGCAVAHALARRGVTAVLLEAEAELALGASGANSGILHTGFDSTPGELETRLILRAAALREELLDELGIAVWRCGAVLAPRDADARTAVEQLAENARANGVEAQLGADGALSVPGESVTDPVAYVTALASAASAGGASIRLGARVTGLAAAGHHGEATSSGSAQRAAGSSDGLQVELGNGERLFAHAAVNCAGLHADELARHAGDDLLEVYPRKGEFLVFPAPDGPPLERILLPVPSALGKGVLVFPTLDRRAVIAGPTARERADKRDWSVEPDAAELIVEKARRMHPALEGLEPSAAYAGLRPAGRGANYVIERSRELPGLIHVAAIRSTGLSASLAIGEHVVAMLAEDGSIAPGPARALPAPSADASASSALVAAAPSAATASPPGTGSTPVTTWWERAAQRSGAPAAASPGSPEAPASPGSP